MLICGIIKPHALTHETEICTALLDASVHIIQRKTITYTRDMIGVLYDHMTETARDGIARELVSSEGRALLLEVESISTLLEVVGTESDPRICAPGTIRARFGVHTLPTPVGSELWWQNAFHRPVDEREAVRDLAYIFGMKM